MEERKRGIGRVAGLRSFVHVPADVRLLIYDSLAHSKAHNFRLIPPREIRTMILLSTCSGTTPKTVRTGGGDGEGGEKNDDFSEGSR